MSNFKRGGKATLLGALLISVAVLTGCTTGGAYSYVRTSDTQCTLTVDTGRKLEGGISIQLIECDITVDAGKVESGSNSIKDVVDLLKIVKTPPGG